MIKSFPISFEAWLRYSLLTAFVYSFALNLQAQIGPTKQWDKTFGGSHTDELYTVKQTSDGGYLIGGASRSGVSGDKSQPNKSINDVWDYWVVKLDAAGNKTWDKSFGGDDQDGLTSLQQTSDGGYILGGFSSSGISGDKTQASKGHSDFWVVKLDSAGNKLWDKTYGGNNHDHIWSVQQTSDGGYILGGSSTSFQVGDKSQPNKGWEDYWVVKLDASGNKLWDKSYGGSGSDELLSMQQTTDGGYILGGISVSGISGDKTGAARGYNDYWIVKIDSAGNQLWDKTFGGTFHDYFASLQQTSDGGYLLGGTSLSAVSGDKTMANKGYADYWVLKLDAAGNKIWDKTYGGIDYDGLTCLQQTPDGGYILGGGAWSGISGDKTGASRGYWVVRTDAAGTKLWDKAFAGNYPSGGVNPDNLRSLDQTSDGGYILGGTSGSGINSDKSQPSRGGADYWVVKLGKDCGNLTAYFAPSCNQGATNLEVAITGTSSWTLTYLVNGVSQTATGTSPTFQLPQNASVGTVYSLVCIASATCTTYLNSSFTVQPVPGAPAAVAGSRCGTGPVTLSATGAPAGGKYLWYDAPNGGTALFTDTARTFITPALNVTTTYYVGAANNAGCEGPRTPVTAIINSLPVVNAGSAQTICSNDGPIQLTGFSPAGGIWSGPGVNPSGVFSPNISGIGNQPLTYTVTQNGCSVSAIKVITVTAKPLVYAGMAKSICAMSAPVQLSGFGPAGGTWSGPGVSATGLFTPNVSLIGNQTLTYTVTQNGCTASDLLTITVTPLPILNPGPAQTTCESGPWVYLGFTPYGGTWSGPGVDPDGWFKPSPSLIGNQTLTYTFLENGCTVTATRVVTVTATPVVNAGTNTTVCANAGSFQLTGFSPAGGTWSGPGVTASGLFTPTTSLIGNQTLTYTVTQNGCTVSATRVITVTPLPVVYAGNTQTVCADAAPFQLSGFSPTGGTWSGPGVSATGLFTPNVSLVGNQNITYTVTQNGCTNSATRRININALPGQPVITLLSPDTLISSVNGNSYEWKLNGTTLPNNTRKLKVTTNGTYAVRVKDGNNCNSAFSLPYSYNISGLKDNFTSMIELYPNPSTGLVNLVLKEHQLLHVTVLNPVGQVVLRKTVSKSDQNKTVQLDLSGKAKGIYLVQVSSEKWAIVRRIVLE